MICVIYKKNGGLKTNLNEVTAKNSHDDLFFEYDQNSSTNTGTYERETSWTRSLFLKTMQSSTHFKMIASFTKQINITHHRSLSKILLCLSLTILIVACTGKSKEQSSASKTEEPSIQEKIKIKELDGKVIDLNGYKGKTIFINFWATWCGPCIKEMPSIERAKNALKDSKIEFLVASNEAVEQIQSFTTKRNLNLHYVQLQNLEELAIPALPTTYIISPSGELVFSETGYREWDEAANIELLTKIINSHE